MTIDLEIKIDEEFQYVKKDGQWVDLWEYNREHERKHPGRR